jgi:hypothetical protein
MVDDGGVPPLPRRVPGASGSPRPTVRVELGTISEDLRRRVLTAIAHELELDEAERRRSGASPPIGAGASPANGASASLAGGSGPVFESSDAGMAASHGVSPANGSSATSENGSGVGLDIGSGPGPGERAGGGLDYGIGADPVYVSPWERNALWPGTPAQPGDITQGEAAERGHDAEADAAAAQEPRAADEREEAIDAADAAGGQSDADLGPQVPLPRRAPGTNGAPPPPAELRREYLPSSVLGRRLDPETHTEPLPRISGTRSGHGLGGPRSPAETGSGQSAPSVFTPIRRAAAPPAPPTPAGSPAEPGLPAPAPSIAASAGAPAEAGASSAEAVPSETVPPNSAPPRSVPSAATIAAASAPTMPTGSAVLTAASAPTMPAGSAAMAAASAPTMPVGSAAMAAAAGLAPPAETDQTGENLPPPADLVTAPASSVDVAAPADQAAPPLETSSAPPPPLPAPSTSAQSRPPAASLPTPSGYGWTADPSGSRPPHGRGAGPAMPLPAALPTAKRPQPSGRPYRIAGVILAVVALIVAGVIALVLSGGSQPGHRNGLGPPSSGAGALVRRRVATWVAAQVGRTAVVACDPVMCQALTAHGVAPSRLYPLSPQTTSPLRSQIIVATAAVRAQFGSLLSSVYAPAVLASFGVGPDRIDIRATAQHGAAAYRAMLSADLANRKATGVELLNSGRIAATALARRELAEGQVDGRLLITIAEMAATHPMFIVDFGSPAPGADPDMPLRQADLAEDAHARHHAGHAITAGYVRAMVSFLRAQHGAFRAARVQSVHLPDGEAVLRIEFTAPSPLGLLGPHA